MPADFQRQIPPSHPRPARRLTGALVPLAGLWLATATPARAHEENSEVITKLNAQIAANPSDPELLLKRAEMHRIVQHWHAAETDYSRAAQLAPDRPVVGLAFATMWNDAAKPLLAIPLLDKFIEREPNNPAGFSERGRSHALLKHWPAAADDFAAAVKLNSQPSPQDFANWAGALSHQPSPGAAIAVLDQGLLALGNVASLEFMALDLEETNNLGAAALARLERMLARPGRKDALLVRKANLLVAAGNPGKARGALEQARAELADLPDGRRLTPATRKVAAEIETLRAQLAALPDPTNKTE